jgi:hypothetical protein
MILPWCQRPSFTLVQTMSQHKGNYSEAEQVNSSDALLLLCARGPISRPGHWLSLLRHFVDLLSPTKQMPR